MSRFQGVFELQTPADLLEKLRHDFSRIMQNCIDTYAAFDFFVTAEHLLDWRYPDVGGEANVQARTDLRKNVPLLRVASHLANGAKHFKTTASRHKSVDDTHEHKAEFDAEEFDPAEFGATDYLVVVLVGDDAVALGPEISVHDLAGRVLNHCETAFKSSGPA